MSVPTVRSHWQRRRRAAPHVRPPVEVREASTVAQDATKQLSNKSSLQFKDLSAQQKISPAIIANVPFEVMSDVQAATIYPALEGRDIFARAKTGTGKTLAFLLPAIQRIMQDDATSLRNVSALIISPTRELARQIANEATKLTVGTRITVKTVVGGSGNPVREGEAIRRGLTHILVGTPGRLLDLIRTHNIESSLSSVHTVVLDEADTLLESGFRKDVTEILKALPDRSKVPRQVLLFSATVPPEVKNFATLALLPNHDYISTVDETEQATHEHVKQEYIIVPDLDAYPLLVQYIYELQSANTKKNEDTKLIVFFNTANGAACAYDMLQALEPKIPFPVFEIHSRLSQSKRDKNSSEFRSARSGILISSDVSARGIDYDDIECVIQMGLPANAQQYIHRLGRTARAGRTGSGLIILTQYETAFLKNKEITKLNIKQHPNADPMAGPALQPWRTKVLTAVSKVDDDSKAKAYQAFLGFYKTNIQLCGWKPAQLVEVANTWVMRGLRYGGNLPPPLEPRTVGKMNLKGVPGLNVVAGSKPPSSRPRAVGSNQGQRRAVRA